MKRILLMLLLAGAAATTAQAQHAAAPQGRSREAQTPEAREAESRSAQSFRDARINADEEKQVRHILAELEQKQTALRHNTNINEEQRAGLLAGAQRDADTRIKAVIGEARFKSWSGARKAAAQD